MARKSLIAYIDLDNMSWHVEPVSGQLRNNYLGGRGLGAYLFLKNASPGCEPLSAENTVVISTGLMGGTLFAPFTCANLITKSPLTSLLSCAVLNNNFASQMRWTGFDHVVIKGRTQNPVYVYFRNEQIELRDAGWLWGMGIGETQAAIRRSLPHESTRLLCIGPAAENRVGYATIADDDGMQTGHTGAGAVLGSKGIKAIVCRGNLDLQVKHPQEALKFGREFLGSREASEAISGGRQSEGKPDVAAPGRSVALDCGINLTAVEIMLDWAAALFKNRIITRRNTRDLELDRNRDDALSETIQRIALRQGFGKILADGPLKAANKIGSNSLNLFSDVNKLASILTEAPCPSQDPMPLSATVWTKFVRNFAGKANEFDLTKSLLECLGFYTRQMPKPVFNLFEYQMIDKMLRLYPGLQLTEADLAKIAYRSLVLERLFDVREIQALKQSPNPDLYFNMPVGLDRTGSQWNGMDIKKFKAFAATHNRANGWDKEILLKKRKVFDPLDIGDLWELMK